MRCDATCFDIGTRTGDRLRVGGRDRLIVVGCELRSTVRGTGSQILKEPPGNGHLGLRDAVDQVVQRIAIHETLFSVPQQKSSAVVQ